MRTSRRGGLDTRHDGVPTKEDVMRKLVYSMGVSLDGFIADRDGAIDWTAPDEELHRFFNEQGREAGMELYGRRLYETMAPWETRDRDPDAHEAELEWAAIWKQIPKVVFSTTLESVEGIARLVRGDAVAEVARLKEEPGEGVIAVGGAGLASSLVRAGLVDEYRLFVNPVVLGAGTPFFPAVEDRIALDLVETRTFGSRVVYLRYVVR
jgi:dihydrofolate reductase